MISFLSYRLKAVPNPCLYAHWYKPTACFCDFAVPTFALRGVFPIIAVKLRKAVHSYQFIIAFFHTLGKGVTKDFLTYSRNLLMFSTQRQISDKKISRRLLPPADTELSEIFEIVESCAPYDFSVVLVCDVMVQPPGVRSWQNY